MSTNAYFFLHLYKYSILLLINVKALYSTFTATSNFKRKRRQENTTWFLPLVCWEFLKVCSIIISQTWIIINTKFRCSHFLAERGEESWLFLYHGCCPGNYRKINFIQIHSFELLYIINININRTFYKNRTKIL